jgi:sulfite reductase (NADPH) hemoprotein beta-component
MTQTLHALTANRLTDGLVVFWTPNGWAERFPDAELFTEAAPAENVLAEAKAQPTVLVDPYMIDVKIEDGQPVPTSYRERVRALGPTIHPEMGKQAEGGPIIEAIQKAAGAARSSGRLSLIRRK